MMLARFYIGLRRADGAPVSDADKRAALARFAARYDGFNASEALGYWRGQPEPALILETATADNPIERAEATALAGSLARMLGQESVALAFLPLADWILAEGS